MYDPVKLVLLNNPPNGFGFVSFSSFYGYFGSNHMIYLYFTEKIYEPKDINDIKVQQKDSNYTTRNRVYEYSRDGIGSFSNPRLILDMPAIPGPYHNGGKIHMDKSGNLYAVIGDLTAINNTLQNYPEGKNPSTSIPNNSVIIRMNPSKESHMSPS